MDERESPSPKQPTFLCGSLVAISGQREFTRLRSPHPPLPPLLGIKTTRPRQNASRHPTISKRPCADPRSPHFATASWHPCGGAALQRWSPYHRGSAPSTTGCTTVEERPFRAAYSAKEKRGFSPLGMTACPKKGKGDGHEPPIPKSICVHQRLSAAESSPASYIPKSIRSSCIDSTTRSGS
jgi:hypothetical protein